MDEEKSEQTAGPRPHWSRQEHAHSPARGMCCTVRVQQGSGK